MPHRDLAGASSPRRFLPTKPGRVSPPPCRGALRAHGPRGYAASWHRPLNLTAAWPPGLSAARRAAPPSPPYVPSPTFVGCQLPHGPIVAPTSSTAGRAAPNCSRTTGTESDPNSLRGDLGSFRHASCCPATGVNRGAGSGPLAVASIDQGAASGQMPCEPIVGHAVALVVDHRLATPDGRQAGAWRPFRPCPCGCPPPARPLSPRRRAHRPTAAPAGPILPGPGARLNRFGW